MINSGRIPATLMPPEIVEDVGYEVVNGSRVELLPPSASETVLASNLQGAMWQVAHWVGHVVMKTLFLIDPADDLERRPDVAFVSYARWARRRPITTNAWQVVPNLVVEIVSPENTANEIAKKIRDYFRFGVEIVWVIYPVFEQVYVYTSPKTVRILDRGDDLDCEPLHLCWRLPLTQLFGGSAS